MEREEAPCAVQLGLGIVYAGIFLMVVAPAIILAWQVVQYLEYGWWISLSFRDTVLSCCRDVFPADFVRWLEQPGSWFGLHKEVATASVHVVLFFVGFGVILLGFAITNVLYQAEVTLSKKIRGPLRDDTQKRLVRITAGKVSAEAVLNSSPTATRIWDALPVEGHGSTWGDEIYFSVPVEAKQEKDAREIVAVGELGYWPPGSAFCVFFGRTPLSTDDRPRAASAVNIVGQINGDATVFRAVSPGTRVRLERA